MASLKSVKSRIKSAKNIAQITKAMEMVSAAKMRTSMKSLTDSRPFTSEINKIINSVSFPKELTGSKSTAVCILLLTTSKGLCGSLNTQVFRHLLTHNLLSKNNIFITIGNKGEKFLLSSGIKPIADYTKNPRVTSISLQILDLFRSNQIGRSIIIYTDFISAIKYTPSEKQLLPFPKIQKLKTNTIIEPSLSKVCEKISIAWLENQIHIAIRENAASEHASRMMTMKQATDSSKDIIQSLTLQYNTARQSQITSEISDLVTSRMSVN